MIKRILVPLDLSAFTKAAIESACHVAKRHGAEMGCLTILDPTPPGDPQEDRLSAVEAQCQDLCKEMNVPCAVLEDRDVPARSIVKMAYYYDLLVMGARSFFHFDPNKAEDDTLRKVLAHSVTPVLCVPEAIPIGFEHACVIVDDSPDAARATCEFTNFASAYRPRISMVSSGDDSHCLAAVVRATDYLKTHGFTDIAKPAHISDPIKAISENWFDDLDLVVTGRHSAHRWQELFHGNQATELVRHAPAPVFVGL